MSASISWLDLTSSDRNKVRSILDLFSEQGTVDELGLGSLRDAFSDALFPGTSVLHTRLRYVIFVPWLYQILEHRGAGGDVAEAARKKEIELIDHLAVTGEDGVIGVQARKSLARLPSSVYWFALSRWGIFVPQQSLSWYHTHFSELRRERRPEVTADDPGVLQSMRFTWHPRLPSPPAGFPSDITFDLTRQEAEFVQAQLVTQCKGSLLAWLADHATEVLPDSLWELLSQRNLPDEIAHTLELARQFSLVVEGAPLFYNLMLAEKRGEVNQSDSDRALAQGYRQAFTEWLARAQGDLQNFRADTLWAFVARQQVRCPALQRRFVERWLDLLRDGEAEQLLESSEIRSLIELRERQLKGAHRARLANKGRLSDWRGSVGVGRMQFRWSQVRRLLTDLHEGLAR